MLAHHAFNLVYFGISHEQLSYVKSAMSDVLGSQNGGGNTKVLCICGCGRVLSRAQRIRHMRSCAPSFIAVNSSRRRAEELLYLTTGLPPGRTAVLNQRNQAEWSIDALTAPAFLSESHFIATESALVDNTNLNDGQTSYDDGGTLLSSANYNYD